MAGSEFQQLIISAYSYVRCNILFLIKSRYEGIFNSDRKSGWWWGSCGVRRRKKQQTEVGMEVGVHFPYGSHDWLASRQFDRPNLYHRQGKWNGGVVAPRMRYIHICYCYTRYSRVSDDMRFRDCSNQTDSSSFNFSWFIQTQSQIILRNPNECLGKLTLSLILFS